MNPLVSVVMPVYNSEKYLKDAIDSILNQTYTNFELIIIDDASNDASVNIISSYQDERIKLIVKPKNTGLIISLNMGLVMSKGKYIARMDSDDISLPKRFEKQVQFMEKHPDIGLCGSWVKTFGNGPSRIKKYFATHDLIKTSLLISSHFIHPAVMIRKSVLDEHGLTYDTLFEHAEDYALWMKIGNYSTLANIPKVLLWYRIHEKQVSMAYSTKQLEKCNYIRYMQIEKLGLKPSNEEWNLHLALILNKITEIQQPELETIIQWLLKLKVANDQVQIYDRNTFYHMLVQYAYRAYTKMPHTLHLLQMAIKPPFSVLRLSNKPQMVKFIINCIFSK